MLNGSNHASNRQELPVLKRQDQEYAFDSFLFGNSTKGQTGQRGPRPSPGRRQGLLPRGMGARGQGGGPPSPHQIHEYPGDPK